ncbi:carcinoembryonic antigen-related cell adhesion molecule 20 isoform X3 [Xenopus tropicalis]|uniref:Carcinoembryonic antigen-related cell adhesion molecule 20 isoform X3 n=1 Tax=Xenopus tropicalis TaxID=8364 RepID=A0A8J0SFV6_XENTR|nr:carcinoembryonic antigen-related cell adhesion molecule 20 isoform X3 [Xenopus tropicalis]|eukprot:XP_012813368.1 PREDICTED: carcinoembryonic antigen-related cell adhesion molecule 20 isoform X2 [Xenopus tropicalis]
MRGYLLTVFISLWMESGYGTDVQLIPSHPLVNKSVTLNVRGITEPVTKPVIRCSSPHPKVNETISLICETANWERISWSKDSSSLPSRADLSPDNRTVTLHNITFSDTGQYQCEAKNTVSRSVSDIFTLVVNYNEPHMDNCAASMAGIICGTIAGIALIICTTFLLYKKYILPKREVQKEQPTEGQDSYRIYYNVYAATMAQPAKEELPYMGLEYPTQDTYSELTH